ncbi:MAG: SEC-C metal-binding domain-containing protein, partial [Patescibacteria group bacterium]
PTSQTLDLDNEEAKILLEQKSKDVAKDPLTKNRLLGILDQLWMNHLEELDALSTSVGLRAYGQKDPLVEYRQESRRLYGDFGKNFDGWVFGNIFRLSRINANQDANARESSTGINQPHQHISASTKVGRNDPCPCGSGKKYKRCHGK